MKILILPLFLFLFQSAIAEDAGEQYDFEKRMQSVLHQHEHVRFLEDKKKRVQLELEIVERQTRCRSLGVECTGGGMLPLRQQVKEKPPEEEATPTLAMPKLSPIQNREPPQVLSVRGRLVEVLDGLQSRFVRHGGAVNGWEIVGVDVDFVRFAHPEFGASEQPVAVGAANIISEIER